MTHYLVVYNRTLGQAEVTAFDGEASADDALRARFAAESQVLGADYEVATLAADSIDDLKVTHARFFRGPETIIHELTRS
ncbi:MAG: hypothetical protein ACO1N6_02285 [Microcella sp.]